MATRVQCIFPDLFGLKIENLNFGNMLCIEITKLKCDTYNTVKMVRFFFCYIVITIMATSPNCINVCVSGCIMYTTHIYMCICM